MNTKLLMTSSSIVLGLAGIFALFSPDLLLPTQAAGTASLLVQLMGALYFSLALMNWTAKDSAIGGVYARPVSLANFSHFFIGALLLVKYLLSNEFSLTIFAGTAVYVIFAACFYWLVFRATGLKPPAP
ncbi:MAG: hypothetical protein IH588_16070 [Anaerolineales bacterium]|nr:hypothetical protein [Anaerolineales bacterium]